MGHFPPKHLHTSKGIKSINNGFKFRWWMVVVLVVVIAGIGIVVLRLSHASTWPPEEQAKVSAGVIINIGFPNVTVSYPPYGYKRDFLISTGEAKITQLVAADLEQIYIKNHPDVAPPVTTPPASTAKNGQSQTSKSTTSSTTASSSTTPSSTANSTSIDSNQQTTQTTSEQQIDKDVLLDKTKNLGNVSGYTKFTYSPPEGQNTKTVSLVIDNKIFKIIKKAPYEFAIDTRAYSNGKHKMQLFVTTDNNSTAETVYQVNVDNSSLISKILYYFSLPWAFIFPG